jgi:hypothetical protein
MRSFSALLARTGTKTNTSSRLYISMDSTQSMRDVWGPQGKMISIERPWPNMDPHHFGVVALIRHRQVFRYTMRT